MPPQQNSTLIDSNFEMESRDEELEHFSPILPLNVYHDGNFGEVLAGAKQKKRTENEHHAPQKGSRSISLHGVNSTLQQGNKEIPIWHQDEPCYVSGVTSKTTCNDIIKALIDDGIRFGNNYAHLKKEKGSDKDDANVKATIAVSRDYSDFVITESWRGIERCYDGDMTILPVWKAWSRVHNEIRLTLRHKSEIKNHLKSKEHSSKVLASLKKYLSKVFGFTKCPKKKKSTQNTKRVCSLNNKDPTPDELILVILPDKLYDHRANFSNEKNTSNHTVKLTCTETAKLSEAKLLKERLYRLSETASTTTSCSSTMKRLRRRSLSRQRSAHKRRSLDPKDCIKRRRNDVVPIRHLLRTHIAQKTTEVDQLLNREYILTRKLTSKCKQYKQENELYLQPEKQMEISVREIQKNVEEYAKEIIKTERELLQLKNEIKQDISIINNLKRLSVAPTIENENTKRLDQASTSIMVQQKVKNFHKCQIEKETKIEEPVQFVDNIYEFCDNNASMLV